MLHYEMCERYALRLIPYLSPVYTYNRDNRHLSTENNNATTPEQIGTTSSEESMKNHST